MIKKKSGFILLIFIFLLVLGIRLYFTFQTPNFTLDDSYYTLRQVESIGDSYVPKYFDDLSYSGRFQVFPPLFYYVLSFFSLFLGAELALKIIPNVFATLLVVIVYFIVYELTSDKKVALFASFASGFIPVFLGLTLNSPGVVSFVVPLFFYLIYCFMRINEKIFLYQFLLLSLVLILTSAMSFLFVITLIIYLVLIRLEYRTQNRIELEVALFVTFLVLWVNILLYKKAFLFHSYSLIWQNIPAVILSEYFKDLDVIVSVTNVGLIPLMLGVFAVYKYMFKEQNRRVYLLISAAISVALLLWLKLFTLDVGLVFLGVILILLAGQTLKSFFAYLDKTKISSYSFVFWIVLFVLFAVTSCFSSYVYASESIASSVNVKEVQAARWLNKNTLPDSVVLASIPEGDFISAISDRKNVADSHFLLIRNSEGVYEDVEKMFTSVFKTPAIELLNKYGVNYIYFSPRSAELLGIDTIAYVDDPCFETVYSDYVVIYKSKCVVGPKL